MKFQEWKIPNIAPVIPRPLTDAGYSPLLAALLYLRGYRDAGSADAFLGGGPELLGNPLLMTDMPLAVGRIARAVASNEAVAVYGDYDVDGITSGCLLTDYLRSRGLRCELYIPDRVEEGYGLNISAIDSLHARGVTLLITVDCGVTAVDEAAYAASLGMDMIITDHHECQGPLPGAVAVIDPKRDDCNYPSRDLAGVGVAFKLICAIEGSTGRALEMYSDLVAVGTVADVMPMLGENRYMIKSGLEKLNRSPRPGLRALIEEAGAAEKRITSVTIGFTLAPRLNAAGRLCQASTAASLLMELDPQKCRAIAAELCGLNRDRQALEQDIWAQALALIGDDAPDSPIVLADRGWHQGVIGIAASRLAEAFCVPAVMICLDSELGKGSCRSCGGFNLYDALSACSEHLEGFGGHALAAGLTIRADRVDAFREALADYYRRNPPCHVPQLEAELLVTSPELLDELCVESLELLEPHGSGNPRPQLAMTDAVLESLTPIGGGKHLRLKLRKFGVTYECVFFSATPEALGLEAGARVDAVFCPQINEFRSRRSVQLLIIDLRAHDPLPGCRAILAGELSSLPDKRSLVPGRKDFARLWRRLSSLGGSLYAPLGEALTALDSCGGAEMLCVCLKVFEELGLLTLDFDGSLLCLRQSGDCEKVELSRSRFLNEITGP